MIKKITATRRDVRTFGITFGFLCSAVVIYLLYRGSGVWPWVAAGAAFFFITGLTGYPLLRPVYVGWMTFAFILGWINTRILLGVFYYLVLTPIGLLMRATGKDFLDERIDKEASSYWRIRERRPFDPSRCERQF